MPSLLIDHIGMYRELYDSNGRTGRLELDILFKTIDFLKKYKKLNVVLQQIEIMRLEAGPWDPLNPPTFVKLHTLITEPETGEYADAYIGMNQNIFIPGPGIDDSDSVKKVLGKVDDEMYAAIRVAEAICEQYKKVKRPDPSWFDWRRVYTNSNATADPAYWRVQSQGVWVNDTKAQQTSESQHWDRWSKANSKINW